MLNDPLHVSTEAKATREEPAFLEIKEGPRSHKAAQDAKAKAKAEGRKKKKFDPVQQYMADIRGQGLISREEEKELATRVQDFDDKEAFNKLVVSNLRLVVKIALKFQRFWNRNLLDLIQEGNVGLIQAVRKYDPNRNVKFSYYASFWIKAYIMKYIQDNWRMVKVVTTEGQRKLFYKLKQERKKLRSQGIEPNPQVLSEKCGVNEAEIIEMDQRLQNWDISLDAPVKEDSDTDRIDLVRNEGKSLELQYCDKEADELINNKVNAFRKTICKREREILDLRIFSDTPMTLQALGDRLGLSRERVRQLEKHIITELKQYLIDQIHDFEALAGLTKISAA